MRYSRGMEKEEKEIPWGLVVESDEIYSAKAGKWFEVAATVETRDGIKVRAAGMAKFWPAQDPRKTVKVRRGATGSAVDILMVAFSGEKR
jgi:hypothetical protein